MKVLLLTSLACLLALGALRAQESDAASQTSAETGLPALAPDATDGQFTPPTTAEEEQRFEDSYYGNDASDNNTATTPATQNRPWKFTLQGSIGAQYDDNIFISSSDRRADLLTLITCGGGIILGDYSSRQGSYLAATYTGIGELFTRYSDQDAFEQNALLDGQALVGRLTAKGSFQFQDLDNEDIDIGARVRSYIYTAKLDLLYDIGDKAFLKLTGQWTAADYQTYLDSNDERGGLSFNFRPDPVLTVGLGATGGVLNVEKEGSQAFEQGLVSADADLTGKFTLKASGGVESRQYPDGGGHTTPVWELTAEYQPNAELQMQLTGYRHVLNSALYTGYDYISTGVSAGIQYALGSRFTLLLAAGFENTDYQEITAGPDISRSDDYYFVQPGVRYLLSSDCDLEVTYQHRENASSQKRFSFTDNQVDLTVKLTL